MAQGIYLKFYVHENRKHHHILLYEWLLEQAKKIGIPGDSAFRAIAGYGHNGILHEQHFFELAGDMTIEVEFMLKEEDAEKLLQFVKSERIHLFYTKLPAEFGMIEGKY
jgi:uncharacterized protein